MRNKLVILFLFLSGLAFGQSVPNTNTFRLSDVIAVVGGNSLTQCFTNSVDAYFDPTYKGSKDRLSNFRNYTIPSGYASGKWITAVVNGGYIYRSYDYGATFSQVASSRNWRSVAMDTTAIYQTAVVNNGFIYQSVNSGVSWAQVGVSQYWNCVGMNKYSGTYQTAGSDNGIWRSADHGNTWSQVLSGVAIDYIFVSPTGQYQIAATNGGYLWISTNYGVTWTQDTGAGVKNWTGVCVMQGGAYWYGIDNGGYAWYSTDNGASWHIAATFYGNTHYWISIVGNFDGSSVVASESTAFQYHTPSTVSWFVQGYSGWGDAEIDCGNGSVYVAAVVGSGYLWKSLNNGVGWIQIYSTSRAWSDIATN